MTTKTAKKTTALQQEQPKAMNIAASVTNKVNTAKAKPPAKDTPKAKPPAKVTPKAKPPAETTSQNVAPASTMKIQSQGDVDTSADAFLID